MAKPRKRFNELGRALPCAIELPPKVAQYIYREVFKGLHGDETELVTRIVTEWIKAQKLPAVDWDALVAEMIAEQKKEAEADPGTVKKKGRAG